MTIVLELCEGEGTKVQVAVLERLLGELGNGPAIAAGVSSAVDELPGDRLVPGRDTETLRPV